MLLIMNSLLDKEESVYRKGRRGAAFMLFNQVFLIASHRDCLDDLRFLGMGFGQVMVYHFQVAHSQ